MTIILDGHSLTVEKVAQVARGNEKIAVHPEAMKRIKKCRDLLEGKIKKGEIVYGVNLPLPWPFRFEACCRRDVEGNA